MQGKEGHADLLDRLADCGTRPALSQATFRSGGGSNRMIIGICRGCRSYWTAAASHRRISSPGRAASDCTAPRMGPMTAIVYFGEGLVASVLAIVLLAISRLPMSRRWRHWMDPWRICRSSLCAALSRAARTWAASCQTRRRGPHNFANMGLFRAGLFDRRRRVVAGTLIAYAGICSCIAARITVPINRRYHCSSIT
jgi:hypothetical protein